MKTQKPPSPFTAPVFETPHQYLVSKAPLNKVIGVSFPRSGHHLLVNCLLAYYSENPYHQKSDGTKNIQNLLGAWNFSYCDHYVHCRKVPCPHPHTVLQKNHDYLYEMTNEFLDNDKEPGVLSLSSFQRHTVLSHRLDDFRQKTQATYLIQYREFMPAITSYWKLKMSESRQVLDFSESKQEFVLYLDNKEDFERFAIENKKYWNRFMKEWVSSPPDHCLVLSYEELLQNPFESIKRSLLLFEGTPENINEDYLRQVIRIQNIKSKNDYRNFPYYSEKLERYLEKI